jgi:hypothetical protein
MALVPEVVVLVEELNDMNVSSLDDSFYEYRPTCRWEEQSRHAPLPKYPSRRLSMSGSDPKSEPVAKRGPGLPPSRPMRRESLCGGSFNDKHNRGPSADREQPADGKIGKSLSQKSCPTLPVPGLVPMQSRANRRRQHQPPKPRRVVASLAA